MRNLLGRQKAMNAHELGEAVIFYWACFIAFEIGYLTGRRTPKTNRTFNAPITTSR